MPESEATLVRCALEFIYDGRYLTRALNFDANDFQAHMSKLASCAALHFEVFQIGDMLMLQDLQVHALGQLEIDLADAMATYDINSNTEA